jgi:hypothetical protein
MQCMQQCQWKHFAEFLRADKRTVIKESCIPACTLLYFFAIHYQSSVWAEAAAARLFAWGADPVA